MTMFMRAFVAFAAFVAIGGQPANASETWPTGLTIHPGQAVQGENAAEYAERTDDAGRRIYVDAEPIITADEVVCFFQSAVDMTVIVTEEGRAKIATFSEYNPNGLLVSMYGGQVLLAEPVGERNPRNDSVIVAFGDDRVFWVAAFLGNLEGVKECSPSLLSR